MVSFENLKDVHMCCMYSSQLFYTLPAIIALQKWFSAQARKIFLIRGIAIKQYCLNVEYRVCVEAIYNKMQTI